jgi:hypothetical protein
MQMIRPVRNVLHAGMLALAGFATVSSRAGSPGTEAALTVETLGSSDIHLQEMNLQAEVSPSGNQYVFSATESRIDIDYAPARYDIVSQPVRRVEDRTAAELNARFRTNADWVPFAGAGAYRGFTDFRSVWLDEYYGQLFSGVRGYSRVDPQGWHAMAGGRWSYVPGSAILQLTLLQQGDTVSPGYEPQIGSPLLRGRDYLRTTVVRLSTENVLTPTVRSLLEAGATSTTGRGMRYSLQESLNWAVSNTLTLRAVVAGVHEQPAFNAASASLSLERDWNARWFAGLSVRGYRDDGEVVDPLIESDAAPALRTISAAASVRWQGERIAVRLEGGPYRTRYDAVALSSVQFARLYEDRHWRRLQCTASWSF